MALTSLVVCADSKAVQVLSQILRELNIEAEHCGDLGRAATRLATQHFDAVVIDCQDQMSAIELIAGARKSPINRGTLIIGLVDGREQVRDIFGQGANFIVYKPVSVERAASSLRAARGLMAREKRGKLRIALHAPASITYANAENVAATLLDLSEDGLAIQAERRLPPRCKVYFQFNLPGEKSSVRLSGDVVWQDSSGRVGIRFVDVPQTSRRTMNEWIKSSLARLAKAEQNAPRKEPAPVPEGGVTRFAGLGLSAASSNRRIQGRRACHLSADVFRVGEGIPNRCTLSDVSTGGCYVETPSPFPSHTALEIVVRTHAMKLRVRGTVQVVHPGFGMGVQFSLNTADEREHVKQLIAAQAAEDSLA
ncbi:MAG: PilZ domain-containing protein [Terriglobales bacterium]